MNRLTQLQLEFNSLSRDRWGLYADHRGKVTELLRRPSGGGRSRLCVLGAGNCNDLDLGPLLTCHREVHLVDLDAESLARGVARQGLGGHPAVHRHEGVDVTGMLDALATWSPLTTIRPADLAACAEEPVGRLRSVLPGPFEVVASTCLLSPLVDAVVRAVGDRHPQFLGLMRAIRAGHLRLLAHLTAPGGTGVLITDVVSSDSFPALGSVAEDALPGVLTQLINRHNFFHGLNPTVLTSLFRTDPVLAAQVAGVEPVPPWLWNFGPRLYAVWGLKVSRRAGEAASGDSSADEGGQGDG